MINGMNIIIQHIKHKIARSVGILYKITHYLNKQILFNVYYTFVFPYLIYGVEIWGSALIKSHKSSKKRIFKCVLTINFSGYLAPSFNCQLEIGIPTISLVYLQDNQKYVQT